MAYGKVPRLKGLVSYKDPHTRLSTLYLFIERCLQKYPEHCNYRKNTDVIIQFRKSVLQETQNIEEIESLICCGRIEDLILQAERELCLLQKLLPYQPWEPLISTPPEKQWEWPVINE